MKFLQKYMDDVKVVTTVFNFDQIANTDSFLNPNRLAAVGKIILAVSNYLKVHKPSF